MLDAEHQIALLDGRLMRGHVDTDAGRRLAELIAEQRLSQVEAVVMASDWDHHNKLVGAIDALDWIAHLPAVLIEYADSIKQENDLAA